MLIIIIINFINTFYVLILHILSLQMALSNGNDHDRVITMKNG